MGGHVIRMEHEMIPNETT